MWLALVTYLSSGCSTQKPGASAGKVDADGNAPAAAAGKKSRYSLLEDQGPDVDIDVTNIPNATPKKEVRTIAGNLSPYTVLGKTYAVQFNPSKYSQVGLASWYGKKFHGERTSNGEIYNMFAMTAAHKSLPIPCYVRVTNVANNKTVILRVNDRGPFHEDRIIDLTYTAAKKLDFHRGGTAKVRVDIINMDDFAPMAIAAVKADGSKPSGALVSAAYKNKPVEALKSNQSPNVQTSSAPEPETKPPAPQTMAPAYLQVGAFASQEGATAMQKELKAYTQLPVVLMPVTGKKIFRVLIGPLTNPNEMQALKILLTEKKLSTPYLVEAAKLK